MICELCQQLGQYDREADVLATVPMCDERPRYSLCAECLASISAYVETAELLADTQP